MMAVPVPDLLQVAHPAYSLTVQKEVSVESIPSLIDFAERVVERFEFYGSLEVAPQDLMVMMKNGFLRLCESDEPHEVLPIREFLPRLLEEFEMTMNSMSRAFPSNPQVSAFYTSLSDILYVAYDELSGGVNCD